MDVNNVVVTTVARVSSVVSLLFIFACILDLGEIAAFRFIVGCVAAATAVAFGLVTKYDPKNKYSFPNVVLWSATALVHFGKAVLIIMQN